MAGHDTWMPLYIGDYLADTMHLTTAQHGAYLLLLMHAWRSDGYIPEKAEAQAAIVRMGLKDWLKIRTSVEDYFEIGDGRGLYHQRVIDELAVARAMTEQRSKAGKASAAKRERERQRDANENPTPVQQALPPRTIPSQSPSPTPGVTTSLAVEASEAATAFEAYQTHAEQNGWPNPQFMNSTRRYKIDQRLRECGGMDGWKAALGAAVSAEFLKGKQWFDLDWMLVPENFTRLMEGRYAERHASQANTSGLRAALGGLD